MKQVRSPIIVVLGHVDHGKTTLLDTIRHSSVAQHESGGITQRIGAYSITTKEGNGITFIDTPGHELFTSMRQRGVKAADIALLVVAADSSVQPQTVESLQTIQEAKIPFIVVINKIDLPTALPEKVIKDLAKRGVLLEGRGGDIPYVMVSAKNNKNIDTLFELITLVAQMQDIQADYSGPFQAIVIECQKERGGITIHCIVREGTLRVGDVIYAGENSFKVRAMTDERGEAITEAIPGMPLSLLGAGEMVEAGTVLTDNQIIQVQPERKIIERVFDEEKKFLFILRADTYGSLEVLKERLGIFEEIVIIQSDIGDVTERDIEYAQAAKASVLAYRVAVKKVAQKAEAKGVIIFHYELAHELLDEIEDLIYALREKREKESRKRGEGKVLAVFKKGRDTIAGVRVAVGYIEVGMTIDIVRGKKLIGTSTVRSLFHRNDAISKAERGLECGLTIADSIDFLRGDVVRLYV